MSKHIRPYDNYNKPIIDVEDKTTPLVYLNQIRLKKGEEHIYELKTYESVIVMVGGTTKITISEREFLNIGDRATVWDGKAHAVYVPKSAQATILCLSEYCELLIAGGKTDQVKTSFEVRPTDVQQIQYGSDDTKTHRRINHIIGPGIDKSCDKLLVSELFTVGAGGWSGFPPHKHDEDRVPEESRHEEVYLFKFNPDHGFGAQFCYEKEDGFGPIYHLKNNSTIQIDYGYHPCVAAPGYEMYYFTILVGVSQRDLLQYFHPKHAYQLETIPGIKDMISGFTK